MLNIKKNLFNSLIVLSIIIFSSANIIAKDLDLLKEKSFKVKSGQLLTVKTDVGDITIKTKGNDEVYVKIFGDNRAQKKMEFSFDQDENGVMVIGEKEGGKVFGWFSSVDLKYEIVVPTKFDLDLKTSGGDLNIRNITGEFKVKTSGGDVYVKNSQGKLNSGTSGGDITLVSFSGDSELSTSGGDIEADCENGKVFAHTSGGDISIKASDGEVIAKTSGGDIRLNYSGENSGIELRTSGGDIDVKVPSKLNADIDLRTSGGDLDNHFSNNKMSKITKSKLIGKFNNGGERLICKTSGGDVTVLEK